MHKNDQCKKKPKSNVFLEVKSYSLNIFISFTKLAWEPCAAQLFIDTPADFTGKLKPTQLGILKPS